VTLDLLEMAARTVYQKGRVVFKPSPSIFVR
jgi:hypothetical protein